MYYTFQKTKRKELIHALHKKSFMFFRKTCLTWLKHYAIYTCVHWTLCGASLVVTTCVCQLKFNLNLKMQNSLKSACVLTCEILTKFVLLVHKLMYKFTRYTIHCQAAELMKSDLRDPRMWVYNLVSLQD